MLYSSTDLAPEHQVIDANSYPPFKLVDSTVVTRIMEELDVLGEHEDEGIHIPRLLAQRFPHTSLPQLLAR
jgi:hypothetical protein